MTKIGQFGQPGVYNAILPTLTDGDSSGLAVDSSGRLIIGSIAAGAGGTQYADGAARGTATGNLSMIDDGTNIQSAAGDASGNMFVVGNIAAATADSGNPIKVGGKYNSTKPTYTDGQRGDLQISAKGSAIVLNETGSAYAFGDGASNNINTYRDSAGNNLGQEVRSGIFNGSTWDRQRSGGVTGMTGVAVQASPSGGWSFTNISTSTTTTVKSGAGTFHLACINTLGTVASTCTFYDNTAGSGTIIAIINSLTLSGSFTYDISFATGLTVVTTGTAAPNLTVAYK